MPHLFEFYHGSGVCGGRVCLVAGVGWGTYDGEATARAAATVAVVRVCSRVHACVLMWWAGERAIGNDAFRCTWRLFCNRCNAMP